MALILARLFPRSFAEVQIRTGVRSLVSAVARKGAAPSRRPAVTVEADELAAILFTSGSTGPARGALYAWNDERSSSHDSSTIWDQPGEVDLPMLPVFALFQSRFGDVYGRPGYESQSTCKCGSQKGLSRPFRQSR